MNTISQQKKLNLRAFSQLVSLGLACSSHAGDLPLEAMNIRNAGGNILISVFDNARDYADTSGSADQYHTFVSVKPHDASVMVVFPDFPAGTYAVIVIHDENSNNDLDSNMLGIPSEGLSFSNYDGNLSEPTFKEAAFTHRGGKDSVQSLPVIYLD